MKRLLQWHVVQVVATLDLLLIYYMVKKVAGHMDNMVSNGIPEKMVLRYRYARSVERRSYPGIPPKADPCSIEEVLAYLRITPMGLCTLCSAVHVATLEFCPVDNEPLYQMNEDDFLKQARLWEAFRTNISHLLGKTITRQNVLWLWHMKERPMIEH